jgi:hypothetical protein
MIDYRRFYLLTDWPRWARSAIVIIVAVLLVIGLLLFLPDTTPS